ncbi:cation:dicarboxylase symporter family transporter [Vibrio lentus]|nr:cation:dicarboxylase symporter family transporter [Vibrio lentus]
MFQPGAGADLTAASSFKSADAPSLGQVIIDMFPANPIFRRWPEGKTLQVIVFAVLFGIAISAAGKPGERIAAVFSDLNERIHEACRSSDEPCLTVCSS